MAYEMVMPYHLHMPSYFLETFTEYPYKKDVPYIDSSAFELLYFNVLNTYKTYTSIKKNIVGKYPTLVDILRFTFLY